MPNLMETMRQIAANERQAALPMTICFGKVIALAPFRVQIDQKLVLTKEFFIVKSGVSASSFKVGDVLILFRNEGGQKVPDIRQERGAVMLPTEYNDDLVQDFEIEHSLRAPMRCGLTATRVPAASWTDWKP